MIEIRWVAGDDWELWRDLRIRALSTDPDAFSSTLAEWRDADETRWRQGFTEVMFRALAVVDGTPSGMIGCRDAGGPDAGTAVEIVSVWISPAVRGQGVGEALINAVVARMAEDGPGTTVLLHVRSANAPAIRLYRRAGFVDDGPAPPRRAGGPPERRMVHGG